MLAPFWLSSFPLNFQRRHRLVNEANEYELLSFASGPSTSPTLSLRFSFHGVFIISPRDFSDKLNLDARIETCVYVCEKDHSKRESVFSSLFLKIVYKRVKSSLNECNEKSN